MPISVAPVMAADEAMGLANKVRVFLAHAKELGKDGITVAEFGELLFALLRVLVSAADTVPADGPQRKQWVLHAIGAFFDDISDLVVPVYAKPFWILFKPGVRSLVLSLASGAIESILPLIRSAE